jgi:transcriptional regulator with GAF, ATPase, and Fis domain
MRTKGSATGHVCRGEQGRNNGEERKVWCLACGLCQYQGQNCRRCGAALPMPESAPNPDPEPKVIRERVEVACPRCGLFAAEAKLPTLREAEQMLIEEAMRRTHGQPSEASRLLGIGRTTLYRRLHPRKVTGR